MNRPTLDLHALRSFVLGSELGSFAQAAERLNRSTSAVSAQLHKLEEQVGSALVGKAGRGLVLTPAGETLLAYARRLLALNDEATEALAASRLEGVVRLGLQEDFGEHLLTDALGRFAHAHPRLRVEATVGRNAELLDLFGRGQLDLVLAWDSGVATPGCRRLGELPLVWIGRPQEPAAGPDGTVPLVAITAPCAMRDAAMAALDAAGIAWRLAFTSPGLGGVWAAVAAGLGVTVRTPAGLPTHLAILAGLPPLPAIGLVLHRAERDPAPAVRHLEAIIVEGLAAAGALRP